MSRAMSTPSPTPPPPAGRRKRRSFDWSTAVIGTLVVSAGSAVLWRDGWEPFLSILTHDLTLLVDILPKVLAGCLIGAFVMMLLPREVVARWVGGESGFVGLVIATLVGTFLPGGPFSIYPITAALLTLGADVGTATTFIAAWSLLGYNRALVWELPFMGGDFTFWRVAVSLPLPILAGLFARLLWKLLVSRDDPA